MATTTSYGTWNNHGDSHELTVETTGAFDRMVSDYRDAVQAALPEGVYLTGNEFVGPYYEADYSWTGELDLHALIEGIDLAPIVERHDPDNQPAASA